LIDEAAFLVYNNRMEQNPNMVIYAERNAPKRALVRSDGALYVLLLFLVFGAIALSHVLSKQFGINRLYVQLALYALLLIVGYAIYRLRLVDYLYELTEKELIVTQAVGSKQKRLAVVPLEAIAEVGAYRKTDAKPAANAYRGQKSQTTAVWYAEAGERYVLLLNASDTLKEKLSEAIHAQQ
jgi:hypothetical protein